jgi:hypothetical protein
VGLPHKNVAHNLSTSKCQSKLCVRMLYTTVLFQALVFSWSKSYEAQRGQQEQDGALTLNTKSHLCKPVPSKNVFIVKESVFKCFQNHGDSIHSQP